MYDYLFYNDYSEGAHPDVLAAITRYNDGQQNGYGEDDITKEAISILRRHIGMQNVKITFVSGGTQANLIAFAALLKPHESVIAPISGHIHVHEAGAIEATGHKIETVASPDGKLTVPLIQKVLDEAMPVHMTKPKAVFISQATEVGTIYTKSEIAEISAFCRENHLYLYLDGARLGSAIAAANGTLSLHDIASLVDIFYIGGTKNGAALGEALIVVHPLLQEEFDYHVKQRGALLAKGRFIAAQFIALFSGSRYMELATHANTMAQKLVKGIADMGYAFLSDSPTNQLFPILPDSVIVQLQKKYGFYHWARVDTERSAIRLVTSWATKEEAVDEFLATLKKL